MPQDEPSLHASHGPFPWRRLFQYRLRTLLILMAIIPPAIGWWVHSARQQREAVAALKGAGAMVWYNRSLPLTGRMKDPPVWPQWLLDHVGLDYFATATSVSLSPEEENFVGSAEEYQALIDKEGKIDEQILDNVAQLPDLGTLYLSDKYVTDAGLRRLIVLSNLEILYLAGSKVTDAGLEYVKRLTNLKHLHVENTKVTAAGVARLQRSLPNCKINR